MTRRLLSLGRDTKGAAFVEFGLFAPILALFALGIIDLSRGISERFTLQQAVNRSLEMLLVRSPSVGSAEASGDYEFIREEAATAAGVPISQVTLTRTLRCNNAEMSDYDQACPQGQETARYVNLVINKNFDGIFYLGVVPITATGSMRIQ